MLGPICVLTGGSPLDRALVAALAREFRIGCVIQECRSPRAALELGWRRFRKLGPRVFLGQLLLLAYERLGDRRGAGVGPLRPAGVPDEPPADLSWHRVRNVNGKGVRRLLERHRPAVCVVAGTSILRARVLRAAPLFLNLHCGITPAYRGVHGAFWAAYRRDWENAGVTVHAVDAGVDTGPIAAQGRIRVEPTDTRRTLVAKQYEAGTELMIRAVRAGLDGTLRTYRREDLASRQWTSPTLSEYLSFRRVLRTLPRTGPGALRPASRG